MTPLPLRVTPTARIRHCALLLLSKLCHMCVGEIQVHRCVCGCTCKFQQTLTQNTGWLDGWLAMAMEYGVLYLSRMLQLLLLLLLLLVLLASSCNLC